MSKVTFRGGKFNGRSRDFGPDPSSVISLQAGEGAIEHYLRTDEVVEGGAVVYRFSGNGVASPPYTAHFVGGPYNGKGRHFVGEPARTLVIPVEGGPVARYKRAGDDAPGRPFVYHYVDGDGDRS